MAVCDDGCPASSISTTSETTNSHVIVMTCNLTPRKCLSYITPFQAILKALGKDVEIRFA